MSMTGEQHKRLIRAIETIDELEGIFIPEYYRMRFALRGIRGMCKDTSMEKVYPKPILVLIDACEDILNEQN